ncbi:hypothetical protein Dimus_030272 [Dionaea muscipula]
MQAVKKSSESVEDFYDVVDSSTASDEDKDATGEDTLSDVRKKSGRSSKVRRVDPSSGKLDYELIRVQAQLDQAMMANA